MPKSTTIKKNSPKIEFATLPRRHTHFPYIWVPFDSETKLTHIAPPPSFQICGLGYLLLDPKASPLLLSLEPAIFFALGSITTC